MAVDGRKLRDTLRLDSMDLIKFPCSPCEKDGKNVAAIKHCVECGHNLCKICLSYHEKFTKGHQIVENPRAKTQQKKPELPFQRCDKHGGKLVDVYCPSHGVVCCSTCVADKHSSCQGKQFIIDVVKSSPIAKEMSKLDKSMEQLMTRLDKLRHEKQDLLKQPQKEKNDIMKEIGDLRKKINDHLDRMEKTLVADVESRFAGKIQSINQRFETVDTITSSVARSRKILQEAKTISKVELFVQIKQGIENMGEHESRLKQLSSEGEMRSVKLFSNSFKDVLFGDNGNIFGRISEVIIPKFIENVGDYSVRLQSDKKTCDILDFCQTTDGSIVCTDLNNNKLKKLDRSYNLIEHLGMPSTPVALCEVDSSQLAVTLMDDKKVQFVFQQPLKLGRCFSVGDRCRGIDCHDGNIFVCCGGQVSEGPGHIEVYDINGSLLRSLFEGLIKPFYIKALSDGEIFVGDNRGGCRKLFRVNKHDFGVTEINIRKLTDVGGFCRKGEGQLCIPGSKSNNIVLITDDGEQQELLTVKDGIVKPWSLFFNEKQSQLVVWLDESDVIKVYIIKYSVPR